jgi:hypothetical protein
VKLGLIVALVLFSVSQVAQSQSSCNTAIPFVDNSCNILSPASAGPITRCYRFISPGDSVNFTFTSFVPQGTCLDAVEQYQLFSDGCFIDSTNADGAFGGLIPGTSYTLCYTIQCPTDGVINLICTSETQTLPVVLLLFEATPSPDGIRLFWRTGSEYNSMGFAIERSVDLQSWLNIGWHEGCGTSSQPTDYQFWDTSPIIGVSYYRLVQWDLNGTTEVHRVIAVSYSRDGGIQRLRNYNYLGQRTQPAGHR